MDSFLHCETRSSGQFMAVNIVDINVGKDRECNLGMGSNAQILVIANRYLQTNTAVLKVYIISVSVQLQLGCQQMH